MYVIELHDDKLNDLKGGTLAAYIGRRGSIHYAYQVEMHLQEVREDPWQRAYLKSGDKVEAIWVRDMKTGAMQYLARTASYGGEWVLPFVTSKKARIAVGIWGKDARTDEEAFSWAAKQLSKAVTAIILDHGNIRFAWEVAKGTPVLVARGPGQQR